MGRSHSKEKRPKQGSSGDSSNNNNHNKGDSNMSVSCPPVPQDPADVPAAPVPVVPPVLLSDSEHLKQQGNAFFARFARTRAHPDNDQSRRVLLHKAIACYDLADANVSPDKGDVVTLELLRATAKNRGLQFYYLSGIETRRSTRIAYFHLSAQWFSKAVAIASRIAVVVAAEGGSASGDRAQEAERDRGNASFFWLVKTVQLVRRLCLDFESFIEGDTGRVKMGLVEAFILKMDDCGSVSCLPGIAPFRLHMAEMWLGMGRLGLDTVAVQLSEGDQKEATPMLANLYRPIRETGRLGKTLPDLVKEARVMENESRSYQCVADALQALNVGYDFPTQATKDKDELLGFQALDKFHESSILSKGQSVQVLCQGLMATGKVYLQILSSRFKAKHYFKEALDLAGTIGDQVNLFTHPWYVDLVAVTNEIREAELAEEEAVWENKRKPFMEELKAELAEMNAYEFEDLGTFYAFLQEDHPPQHLGGGELEMPDKGSYPSEKKFMVKLISLYHPDKVDKERFGLKYFIMCEEISKALTMRYNKMKGVD